MGDLSPYDHLEVRLLYFNARDNLASDVQRGDVTMEPEALVRHIRDNAGVDQNTAAIWAERFRTDVARHLTAILSKKSGLPK